jgi:hypothetical protein
MAGSDHRRNGQTRNGEALQEEAQMLKQFAMTCNNIF